MFVFGGERSSKLHSTNGRSRSRRRPSLRIADPDNPYEVITDASDIAIGTILLQDFGEGLQPVTYESRKLQGAQKKYTVHDKEMLAIVHAFKTWQCYLTSADVTVRTDQKSLQYLRAQPNLNPRQIRWLDFLDEQPDYYSLWIRSKDPGKTSRWTTYQDCRPVPAETTPSLWVVDRFMKMAHFIACQQKITAEQNCPTVHRERHQPAWTAPPPLFQTETRNSHRISGAICETSSLPNYSFPRPTTHRLTGRSNESTKLWSSSFGLTALTYRHWEKSFPLLEFAYYNAPSATTHHSPFFLKLRIGPS
ncbi:hypothetical protein CLOM_g15073, partial [Closterium sp. NIES-68]